MRLRLRYHFYLSPLRLMMVFFLKFTQINEIDAAIEKARGMEDMYVPTPPTPALPTPSTD